MPNFKDEQREEIKRIVLGELLTFFKSDRYVFEKLIELPDEINIQTGTSNGTQIATDANQKVAFHGATPTVQAGKILDPSGGSTVDSEARARISEIIDAIEGKGITSSS